MNVRRLLLLILVVGGWVACKKSAHPTAVEPAGVPAAAAPVPGPGSVRAASPERPGVETLREPLRPGAAVDLFSRLRLEAANRPTGTPPAEKVFEALEKAGVRVGDRKQYLAATVGARYCTGGRSQAGVAVSVCEYASEEFAQGGRAFSLSRFKAVQGSEIHTNRKTTLSLAHPGKNEAAAAEMKKAALAFSRLK